MPLVSIVLTSYNHGKFIREAIDSVINQTFEDWEMLIVDDASTDDSWEVISTYHDPRIKAFRNLSNQGPIYAFNKLIFEVATGPYIAIHHSDDVWALNKLEKQVAFLNGHPEIGAVFTDVLPIDERGVALAEASHIYCTIFNQPNRSRFEWLNYFFLNGNALCHPSILIRKECYKISGAYRDMLAQLPDFDMWIRLLAHHEIHIMPERLLKFRLLDHEMNTSGSRPVTRIRCVNEHYFLLKQFRSQLSKLDFFKVFPNFIQYDRGEHTSVDYVLARVCLESSDYFLRDLLAIEILFELLNSPVQREVLAFHYGFTYHDFINITGQQDIYSREQLINLDGLIAQSNIQITTKENELATLSQLMKEREEVAESLYLKMAQLNRDVLECNAKIDQLNQVVAERDGQITAFINSTSWKISKPIRYIGAMLSKNKSH